MNELKIYALLSDVDEDIIESTLPPSLGGGTSAPRVREESLVSRFLSNGWVAAVLSAVVAIGVIVAIVLAGRMNPETPPAGSVGESETTVEGETAAIDDPANYMLVKVEFPDSGSAQYYQSWYHSRTVRGDHGELSTIDLGRYDHAVLDEGWIGTRKLTPGTAPTISHTKREGWLYTYTAEVYDTDMNLLHEGDLADLAKMDMGTYCVRVNFKGSGENADSDDGGCVAFWVETWMRLEITTETETTPPVADDAPFTISVKNVLITDLLTADTANPLTVTYTGRNSGEDITDLGTLTLERVETETQRREIPLEIRTDGQPNGFQAPAADDVAVGELTVKPAWDTRYELCGRYRLTATCADGAKTSCDFYVVEPYVTVTPSEEHPFRYAYSIAAPDGWGTGKTVTLYLYKQNISDENIISDYAGSSSEKAPYFQISKDMGEDNPPYVMPYDRLLDEDVTYYGYARGEIVVQSYEILLSDEMPSGYFDLTIDGVLFENAFSSYGIFHDSIYSESRVRSPIRPEWEVATEQYDHEMTTFPVGMPLSAEQVKDRIATLRDSSAGLVVQGQVRSEGGAYGTLVVYDEGGREVARGDDPAILNKCEPNRTYYVDFIGIQEMNWDGEDAGGTVTTFTEYFFPFVRYERADTTAGVEYDFTEDAHTYIVSGLNHEAKAADTIMVDDSVSLFPVTSLADGAFTGCAAATIILPRSVMSVGTAFAGCPNLKEIHYRGTRADWEAVEKAEGWKEGSPQLTKVICTDGELLVGE